MNVKQLYFQWLASLAIPDDYKRRNYESLLMALDSSIFHFRIPLDENRAIDGIQLRYRFGYECKISDDEVRHNIDIRSCSMLEMMVALALRGGEDIMFDPDIGIQQISQWFEEMIFSLKLNDMDNNHFDQGLFDYRIDCLLNREYASNGAGGLFTVQNPREDMRNVEIWYQMCWYLDNLLKD